MKLGYLVSRYPAVSHTFIMREVKALRRHGFAVDTFTVRGARTEELLAEADQAEAERTTAILPVGPLRLIGSHLAVFLVQPFGYLAAFAMALRSRNPGVRAALWNLFYFLEAGVLARHLRRRGVEHLHVHFANVASEVGMLASRMTGITWSLTLHGLSDFGNPETSRLREKIASASFVVSVSDWGRAQAQLCTDVANWPKIHVVRCGIDVTRFTPGDRTPRRANGDPLRLLTVGRLAPEKGHAALLSALAQVRQRGVDFRCTIVGDGPLRGALTSRAAELGLGDRVVFAGAVGQDDILPFYRNADIFVLPSLAEGLPVVLMEAMAIGLPVIASQLTGIPELIRHEQHGLLLTPGRADQLADAIVHLSQHSDDAATMAAAGRRRVEDDFDINRTVESLVAVFESLSRERPCARPDSGTDPRPGHTVEPCSGATRS